VKNDGKMVRSVVNSLIKRGYLLPHKGGKTISQNPSKKREILEKIEKMLS
jgi:ribosomal protein S19E (S16A)